MSHFIKKVRQQSQSLLTKRPITAFILLLVLLLVLIVLSNKLRTPKEETAPVARESKESLVYSASSERFLETTVTLKRNSVVDIVALAPGIVSSITKTPGTKVAAGETLLTLTNDYNSGSKNLESALAQNNLSLNQQIENLNKDIASKERTLIKKNDALTDTNESIALWNLEKERLQSKVALANSQISLDLVVKSDAVLRPKALTSGVVQSIKVRAGQYVAPGQTVATLYNPTATTTLEAIVPEDLATFVDISKDAVLVLPDESKHPITISYLSPSEDTFGLFTFGFVISEELIAKIPYGQNPKILLPLRWSGEQTILLPLDSVFQSSNETTVNILNSETGKAESRTIELGSVRGNFVEVKSGIADTDIVLLNRFVTSGDTVTIPTK